VTGLGARLWPLLASVALVWPVTALVWPVTALVWPLTALVWPLTALVWPQAAVAQEAAQEAALTCELVFGASPPQLNACQGGGRLTVALVGDVLLHAPLQRRGYAEGFRTIWGAAEPFLLRADIAVANLEGPVAAGFGGINRPGDDPGPVFGTGVYTSFPMFNYHPRVLADLFGSGIDLVTTANNHALDRGGQGLDATLDAIAAAGLLQAGAIRGGAAPDFVAFSDTALGRIVWIACTFSTNGIGDPQGQVLMCFQQRAAVLALIAAYAAQPGIAAVVVLPHWGEEYQNSAAADQRGLAAAMVAAGATVVVGTHPHVVQDWQVIGGPAGQVPVIYSTGNFVSGQPGLARETGMLAWLSLCRGASTGDLGQSLRSRLVVERAGWVPLRMGRAPEGVRLFSVGPDGAAGYVAAAAEHIEGRAPGFSMGARFACRGGDAPLALALQ